MINLKNLIMQYDNNSTTPVLNNINLSLAKNDWVNVLGASGSGKTTLLNIIGGLLEPTEGTVYIDETNLYEINRKQSQKFRRDYIGFVFQDFKLFQQYTVLENVMIPLLPYEKREKLENKAMKLLEEVDLSHRLDHFPSKLSGGEKQRVSIARALLNEPAILLCDEPTGNLDTKNTKNIMQLLQSFHQTGITIIFVTHDESLASYANKLLRIRDGEIKELIDNESTVKEKSE